MADFARCGGMEDLRGLEPRTIRLKGARSTH
jgi:hypothetical protein